MNFPSSFQNLLTIIFKKPYSHISNKNLDKLEISELVTRFLYKKKGYWDKDDKVLPGAFTPSNKSKDLSTYRIKNCEKEYKFIWYLADKFVTRKMKKPKKDMIARVEITYGDIINSNLTLNPTKKPYPRHANIEKWPMDDKIRMKAIKTDLAMAAGYVIKRSL